MALHIPTGSLKSRSVLEPVARCEPNTYQSITVIILFILYSHHIKNINAISKDIIKKCFKLLYSLKKKTWVMFVICDRRIK